ncbi:MAG: molybdenum cofactor guanylyltransferase [Pseudomonadota bacterium]
MFDTGALVLAGGKSSRMGEDKAGLRLQGQTLLQRTHRLLESAGCSPIIVCGEKFGGIADEYPEQGPLGGIHAGLQQLIKFKPQALKQVLVVPVDMPKLTVPALKRLIACSKTAQAACYHVSALPCVLPLNWLVIDYLQKQLATTDSNRSIRGLLGFLDSVELTAEQPSLLINTNTPQQWQQVIQSEDKGKL